MNSGEWEDVLSHTLWYPDCGKQGQEAETVDGGVQRAS